MPIIENIKSMGVDALIALREGYRTNKLWKEADLMRDELDSRNVYVFDEKNGKGTAWHLNDAWFGQMNKDGFPQFNTRRAYVEYRMRQHRSANAFFYAWLDRMRSNRKPLTA